MYMINSFPYLTKHPACLHCAYIKHIHSVYSSKYYIIYSYVNTNCITLVLIWCMTVSNKLWTMTWSSWDRRRSTSWLCDLPLWKIRNTILITCIYDIFQVRLLRVHLLIIAYYIFDSLSDYIKYIWIPVWYSCIQIHVLIKIWENHV